MSRCSLIRQLLERDFFKEKLSLISDLLDSVHFQLEANDRGFLELAERQEVAPQDVAGAREALKQAIGREDPSEDPNLWVPRDRFSSVLQSVLESYYIDQKAVARTQAQGLAALNEPVT